VSTPPAPSGTASFTRVTDTVSWPRALTSRKRSFACHDEVEGTQHGRYAFWPWRSCHCTLWIKTTQTGPRSFPSQDQQHAFARRTLRDHQDSRPPGSSRHDRAVYTRRPGPAPLTGKWHLPQPNGKRCARVATAATYELTRCCTTPTPIRLTARLADPPAAGHRTDRRHPPADHGSGRRTVCAGVEQD